MNDDDRAPAQPPLNQPEIPPLDEGLVELCVLLADTRVRRVIEQLRGAGGENPTSLAQSLAGLSASTVEGVLAELASKGVAQRRGADAEVADVYELTEAGRRLDPVVERLDAFEQLYERTDDGRSGPDKE